MTSLSLPPPSRSLAFVSFAAAVSVLVLVVLVGEGINGGISTAELANLGRVVMIMFAVLSGVPIWTSVVALQQAFRSNQQVAIGNILEARASASNARQSALISLGLASALIVCFGLVELVLMNDGNIQKTFFRWDLMHASAYDIARAFVVNIRLALASQILVMAIGLLLAVARMAPGKAGAPLRFLAVAYIDLMRAIPAIIVLYLIGFGLPLTNLPIVSRLPPEGFAIFALTLTYSAYVAEIYRSGIDSIHPSQWAASRSLGFGYMQTLRFFILPQAVRIVIPPLLSAFIALQKDTSLVNVIGTLDAFNQAKFYASSSFNLSSVTVVAILFVVITIPQARFVDWMLQRTNLKRTRG